MSASAPHLDDAPAAVPRETPDRRRAKGDGSTDGAQKARRVRSHQMKNMRLLASSYVIDGLVMLLFWWAGTVSWVPAVSYTASGLALTALTVALYRSNWVHRLKDPNLTMPLSAASATLQLTAMALVPKLAFMFALILFIVYLTMMLRAPVRLALAMWFGVSVAVGTVIGLGAGQLTIPSDTLAEQALSWGFFALTLGRCILLGRFNRSMTLMLKSRSTELAELTRKVELLAHHDELTGLLNRRSLLNLLTDEQQRATRGQRALCVALLDLDKFKSINDTLGHLAGDKTLKLFASTMQSVSRRTDRMGRYGGEEFLLVLVDTSAEDAIQPVERLREALCDPAWDDIAPGFRVTFSCGLAVYQPGESTEDVIKRADDALYRAKREGRNCTRMA